MRYTTGIEKEIREGFKTINKHVHGLYINRLGALIGNHLYAPNSAPNYNGWIPSIFFNKVNQIIHSAD
ncbi:MAG: hypothetical protein IKU37_02195 [Candidatus Gastranaerophilales bacterium]|nr:hypothetical protein [Candidatus Gastranaerophilales bacterium]